MIVGKEDEVLRDGFNYSFGFRFDMGWKELGLLIQGIQEKPNYRYTALN